MRGEKVDVNTISQNVQEGMGNVKDKMKGWGGEVKEAAQRMGDKAKEFSNTRGKTFAAEVREVARPVRSGLGHAIGVIFKVFFLFIAGTIAFALFVALISIIFGGVAWWPINNFLWTSNWQQAFAWGTLILFLGVPLIGFLIWIIRRIIGVKSRSSYLGWTFAGLWTLGWACIALLGASIGRDISNTGTTPPSELILNSQPAKGRVLLTVSEPELVFNNNFWWNDNDWDGWSVSSDTMRLSFVNFKFDKSADSSYHVYVTKQSQGRTESDARNRAEKIQYKISYKDSVLDLGSGFAIDKDSKYRGQTVEIRVYVPVGKRIRFDESVKYKLNPMRARIRNRRGVNLEFDNEYRTFPWKANTDYIMGSDGTLKNADGTSVEDYNYHYNDNNYRYEENRDSAALREQIQKGKEAEEKLKQINREKQTKKDSGRAEAEGEKDETNTTVSAFPILSPEIFF